MNDVSRPAQTDRSIPDLMRDLTSDVKTLARDEIELFKIEMTRKVKKAGESAGFFGATAILGLGAFLALTITLVAALALVLPFWSAALIVTVAYVALALLAAKLGMRRLQAAAGLPSTSASSIRADIEVARVGVERGR